MKNSMRNVMLVSALVALPSLALAQAGAAGAVTGAAHVNPPALPPPTVQVGGAINGAAAGATSVRPPMSSPANVNSSAAAQAVGGASASPSGVTGNATTNSSTAGQISGPAVVSGTLGQNTSITFNSASTINDIQTASFATRQQLASSLESRVAATQGRLDMLRARADAAGDSSRAAFGRAMNEVRAREKALRESLKATVRSTGESTWGSVQSTLASDYSAYAQAVASAEAAAQGSAATGVTTP